jgi:hypothetical protein
MRHRLLEDAITVAEQQTGLPWKWHMGDFSHGDVWTSSTFHSFEPIVMSTNATNSLL